jgi:hypothetical protein
VTDDDEEAENPQFGKYSKCGQYPGAVPAGATVALACDQDTLPGRYVIIQMPKKDDYMNVCEIEVYGSKHCVFFALYNIFLQVIRRMISRSSHLHILSILIAYGTYFKQNNGVRVPYVLSTSKVRFCESFSNLGSNSDCRCPCDMLRPAF